MQGQVQDKAAQSTRLPLWLCMQIGATGNTDQHGATAGTLCVSLTVPTTPTPLAPGKASNAETMVCFPVKEQTFTELAAQD